MGMIHVSLYCSCPLFFCFTVGLWVYCRGRDRLEKEVVEKETELPDAWGYVRYIYRVKIAQIRGGSEASPLTYTFCNT